MKPSVSVDNFLDHSPKSTLPILLAVRNMVRSSYPEAKEIIFHGTLGYTPSGHPFDRIIYIWPTKDHVTLGFFFGKRLSDPERLLVGEGKRMRHVKVRTKEEAKSSALLSLVKAARADGLNSQSEIHNKKKKKTER